LEGKPHDRRFKMKSHSDEIWEKRDVSREPELFAVGLYEYAKGLEFALECIGKGMKIPNSDFTCPHCTNPKPHIHGKEAARIHTDNVPVFEESFHAKHGPGKPCGKPFCVLCYPDGPGGQPKEEINSLDNR